jgi:hypothetical protein
MLRIHFPRHCFNLSNPALEEALYDHGSCANLSASIWDGNRFRMKGRAIAATKQNMNTLLAENDSRLAKMDNVVLK